MGPPWTVPAPLPAVLSDLRAGPARTSGRPDETRLQRRLWCLGHSGGDTPDAFESTWRVNGLGALVADTLAPHREEVAWRSPSALSSAWDPETAPRSPGDSRRRDTRPLSLLVHHSEGACPGPVPTGRVWTPEELTLSAVKRPFRRPAGHPGHEEEGTGDHRLHRRDGIPARRFQAPGGASGRVDEFQKRSQRCAVAGLPAGQPYAFKSCLPDS
jgi:hypothetical protein